MGPLTQCDDIITGRDWNTETGTQGKHHMKVKAETVVMLPWTRDACSPQKPGDALTAPDSRSSLLFSGQDCPTMLL